MPTAGGRTLHNPRVTIVTRAGLLLAATVFAAACAPADAPSTTGPSAPASAAGAACPKGALPTLTAGTLTIGTDQPVYPPWYIDDDPANGQGFESAVAYAVAEKLGYAKDKVAGCGCRSTRPSSPGRRPSTSTSPSSRSPRSAQQAVDFSAPYYDVKQAVVALDGQPGRGRHDRSPS